LESFGVFELPVSLMQECRKVGKNPCRIMLRELLRSERTDIRIPIMKKVWYRRTGFPAGRNRLSFYIPSTVGQAGVPDVTLFSKK